MYHPNFVDTIPTDRAPLHTERHVDPDPRPKWAFRFTMAAIVFTVVSIALTARINICPIN